MTFADLIAISWYAFGIGEWVFVFGMGGYYLYKELKGLIKYGKKRTRTS